MSELLALTIVVGIGCLVCMIVNRCAILYHDLIEYWKLKKGMDK